MRWMRGGNEKNARDGELVRGGARNVEMGVMDRVERTAKYRQA
jgi:hypothetical protein